MCSSNDQKFCKINDDYQINYIKIENDDLIKLNGIKKVYYNLNKLNFSSDKLTQHKFSFLEEILTNNQKLIFLKDKIIKPKFISNNTLLN